MRTVVSVWMAILLTAAGVVAGAMSDSVRMPRPVRPDNERQLAAVRAEKSRRSDVDAHHAVLKQYCITCHNKTRRTANLTLDDLALDRVGRAAEVWEKVVRKLRTEAMPPAGVPRPDKATYDRLTSWLESELDAAAAREPNPGRSGIHRLNRAEYANAVRDLLNLEVDAALLLPPDDSSYGFDNIGDALTFSPGLVERYLSAAQQISRRAIGDLTMPVGTAIYTISPTAWQDERMSDDLPFGSRGGLAVRHEFPLDGEYRLTVRLRRGSRGDAIQGLRDLNWIEVRLDGQRIKEFSVGGPRVLTAEQAADEQRQKALTGGSSLYERTADEGLEARFAAKAGVGVVGVSFVKRASLLPEGRAFRLPINSFTRTFDVDTEASIESVRISGPYHATGVGDTPSRRRIFICSPTAAAREEACARKILAALARRAYRRAVMDADLETLLRFYREADEGFEGGIRAALERLLVSPYFLVRMERDPRDAAPGSIRPLSSVELASRLSFFLWSSIPDDELLDLAIAGKLSAPRVLEMQVQRMLRDRRSTALVKNFVGQWLYLRNLSLVTPSTELFPDFDESLRADLQRETELFFEYMIQDNRSVLDIMRANYTFLNERLARHYNIPNVYGNHFRRVTLPVESPRGWLLGQGSILTVTSFATRTAPTIRGKWVLENLLGAPPPPPPPNVNASLPEQQAGSTPSTVRERLEQHRKNPVCAGCHSRMDSLGLALESFDAIGQLRTTDQGRPIDATGVLPDGEKFNGPAGLRRSLIKREKEIVTVLTERLLTYALGRGLEHYDMPAVRQVIRSAAAPDYRWSSLVFGIVKSRPFQMRRVS